MTKVKVLIADDLAPGAADIFKNRGIEVDFKVGLKKDELIKIIGEYDGLAVRSACKPDKDVIAAGTKLKVIGRAGIGVDNVDVKAATAKGVIVMNTPFGNAITTAEHAIAMMFSAARQIPSASQRTIDSPLIRAYRGDRPDTLPVWFMRQAGRSLPEYRKLREGTTMIESCLRPDLASEIMKFFTERQRNEVMVRIATLDGIQPAALRDLNEVMSKVLAGGDKMRKASLGGVKPAAEIINMMGGSIETSVLDYIREADNELAQKIMDNMFTFDDLVKVDDKGVQSLLKEVQSESLIIALKGATPELRDKVFKNMSSRAAETLKEDLESRGPVRVSEVESEQKEMLKIVRRLADEGQIQLTSGSDDDFL